MTATEPPGAAGDPVEAALLLRVLSTLLREDVCGLRTRSIPEDRRDGRWLRLRAPARTPAASVSVPAAAHSPGAVERPAPRDTAGISCSPGRVDLLLPVRDDGFQCAYAARLPLLRAEPARPAAGAPAGRDPARGRTGGRAPGFPLPPRPAGVRGRDLVNGPDVLAALGEFADAEDRPGFEAFAGEYGAALAALRLQAATREETVARLVTRYGPAPGRWQGLAGSLGFDTLAARQGHPLYPTGAARPGLTADQLKRYAPEFAPSFALRWLLLPRDRVTVETPGPGPLAAFWPSPADLGHPGLDGSHVALPVHPATAAGPLPALLREREARQGAGAVLAERPYLAVEPTLSTRTVAPRAHPGTHLKLPLATSTLGRLNRRSIKPGTLVDGAAAQRLLAAVTAREPRFRGRVLHCDETRWMHAGHELLAVLVRRYPAGLDGCAVLPLAALAAPAPDGRPVADHVAARHFGGDPVALLDAVWTLLLDWQVTLFGYGVALESHQQNVSLLLDEHGGATRLRLLFKDDDGLRIHRRRLAATLGPAAPGPADFDDPRITVEDDAPLLALFTTITVHLCAGALAYALSGPGRAPLPVLLGLVRDRLAEAVDRLAPTAPGPARALRAAVLDADRLPVKAMVTAGTLLSKQRSGASDINKFYTFGPNYLLRET
ncbi:IucA/IucC family protein [Actinacidiphila epipremni]|uniref:IucA/IucC family protein n=1 Tax=Actinacidiphila epipremni TaxID=2053013 RepID=UPI002AFE3485|nr:IucA/IucC family protein [Actinacidiphila epipremni]